MADGVRASVIVVSFNSRDDLPACLSALAETIGAHDEVIVYDNGSTDDSAEVARSWPVRVARSVDNHGFAGAANRAALLARGHVLVFLNPDTAAEPGWLDALLAPLRAGPGLATANVVLLSDPTRIDAIGNLVHLSGITVCRGHARPAAEYSAVERVLAVSGACFAIDRTTFDLLNGFDERYFMYLEDTDLSMRAALAGVPIWAVGASRVRHRHVPSFGPRKLYWLERNRWMMLLKLWSARTLLSLTPMLLLVELLTWAYAIKGGKSAVAAKAAGYGWLARHAWSIVAARRRVQRLRRVDDEAILARCVWKIDMTELVASPILRRLVDAGLYLPFALATLLRVAIGGGTSRVEPAALEQ